MMTLSSSPLAPWIRNGFVGAALFNFGIVAVSRGFSTNLRVVDPLFSPAGCQLIALWGLAYLSVARSVHLAPHIAAVFALEKLFYGVAWIQGWTRYGDKLGEQPFDVAMFFRTYGAADFAFALFFGLVWWRLRQNRTPR
jgi:uncharacterized membrane protein